MTWLSFFTCLAGLAVAVGAAIVNAWRSIRESIYDPHAVPRAAPDDGVRTDTDTTDASMPIAPATAAATLSRIAPAPAGATATPASPPKTSSAVPPGADNAARA